MTLKFLNVDADVPTAQPGFAEAALALADRLDAVPAGQFMQWTNKDQYGRVILPRAVYDETAHEWVELLTPYKPDPTTAAYAAVADRAWDNAEELPTASWADTLRFAATIIGSQVAYGGAVLDKAHGLGLMSAILRRLAELARADG